MAADKAVFTALDDALDVAIWLSALVDPEGEEWPTWEETMRPKLFAALDVLNEARQRAGQ